ncbi:putative baseplate assembly protein [Leptolyngbya sp. AN10]|uniref:putative baseplate assembly protein n=1 Tax=Leptolyngbya sp. AN10 TaxID=3423365 RepID=UPI003D319898
MNDSSLTTRNPPGLSALTYRISNYTTARQRILESLYVPLIPDGTTLAALKTRDRDDLSIALIDAWAMVIDVLTFYQERIANEGFWRTAIERRSLLELARTIGAELDPGAAASTYLVFTVETTLNAPKIVTVEKGTAIASIPGENEQSQIFETSETFIARAEWNALTPRKSRSQTITPETNQLYLQGLNLQLQIGDRLLLSDADAPDYQYLLKLTAVELVTDQQQTRITWEAQNLGEGSPLRPQLFAFRQRIGLFGNIAPKWETLPDEVKQTYGTMQGGCFQLSNTEQWTGISSGLPTIDIWSLTASETALFAGTGSRGIYRSTNNGVSWQSAIIGLSNLSITVLYYHAGSVFAGSPSGGVFRSKDNGETWTAIGTGSISVQPNDANRLETINTSIPNTVVRSILAYQFTVETTRQNYLFVGTDDGIFRSEDDGQNWSAQGLRTASVRALLSIGTVIYAGTDQGIFLSNDQGATWETGSLDQSITSLATITVGETAYLFAGTKNGVYRSSNSAETWEPIAIDESISAFAIANNTLFAATTSGKVFNTQDGAEIDPNAIKTAITALTVLQNRLIAGTRFAGFVETDWSYSQTPENELDLDAVYPQILPKSWLVCLNQEQFQAVRIENVNTAIAKGFTLEAPVSRITAKTVLDRLPPRTTTVLAQSELLTVAELSVNRGSVLQQFQDPIGAQSVYLEQFVPGLQAGQHVIVSGKLPRIQINQVGGVFQQESDRWFYDNLGLTNLGVLSLTVTSENNYFAGTEQGLFQRSEGHWKPINTLYQPDSGIAATLEVRSLCTVSEMIFAGTDSGLFRSINQGKNWDKMGTFKEIRAIAYSIASDNLFVATEKSVFRSVDRGANWTAIDRDLLAVQVQALITDSQGVLFAGTVAHGVWRSSNEGETWDWVGYSGRSGIGAIASTDTIVSGIGTQFSEQLKRNDLIIAMGQTRTIQAVDDLQPNTRLTIDNPFESPGLPEGTPFTLSTGLGNLNVTTLAIDEQPTLPIMIFAGTAGGGIWRSSDGGNHWKSASQDLASYQITTLVAYHHPGVGELDQYGTTIRVQLKSSESLNFRKGASIVIDQQTRTVTTDPQKVATDPQTQDYIVEFTIDREFSSTESRTYTIPILIVGTASHGLFHSLDRGESWISNNSGLTNTSIRAILPPSRVGADYLVGGLGILLSEDQQSYTRIRPGNSLQVLSRPTFDTNTVEWRLRNAEGFPGSLITTTEEVTIQSAIAEDESISELTTLLAAPIDQSIPVIEFQQPLKHCYDPSTVAIHANVVAATHGETIADTIEVLGSGDGNISNQTFVLRKPPLTPNSLEIRVNNLLWHEVPALYKLSPDEQAYIVRTTDEGATYITFGDGITGARLPSGIDNVIATYRSGLGLSGNVAPNKLSLLKTRTLGIQGVNNPVPATGGANPEPRDQIRDRAPLTIRTLDRIVSVRDFEDFTRTFPGIGKAQGVSLWSAQSKVIHLSIAGSEGAEISDQSAFYQSLVDAIEQRRDPYQSPPIITSYERIEFHVEATVLIDSRYLAKQVQTTIATQLRDTFSFNNRAFGQSATAAEIIALIQSIDSVISVDLDALYRVDRPKTLEPSLTASLARWSPECQFTPAQLLLLHTAKLRIQV